MTPAALIVRVNASGEGDARPATSYLAVAKISDEQSCVVARIPASASAEKEARKTADAAASTPCLKEIE